MGIAQASAMETDRGTETDQVLETETDLVMGIGLATAIAQTDRETGIDQVTVTGLELGMAIVPSWAVAIALTSVIGIAGRTTVSSTNVLVGPTSIIVPTSTSTEIGTTRSPIQGALVGAICHPTERVIGGAGVTESAADGVAMDTTTIISVLVGGAVIIADLAAGITTAGHITVRGIIGGPYPRGDR